MRFKIGFSCVISCLAFTHDSQFVFASDRAQIPLVERGTWGYINPEGKTIIKPQYNRVEPFKNGFASVCPTGKSITDTSFRTIIDTHGKALNPTLFFEPAPMYEGFAVVHTPFVLPSQPLPSKINMEATYISSSGLIQQKKYRVCGNYSDGVAICGTLGPKQSEPVQNATQNEKKQTRGIKVSFPDGYEQRPYGYSYFLIDRLQKIIAPLPGIPLEKPPFGLFNFSEGMQPVQAGRQCGFINTHGKLVIAAQFSKCSNFHESMAAVQIGSKWGFVNKSGKISIPCTYKRVSDFSGGLAKVETDKAIAGFIDKSNNLVFTIESFDDCSDFSEGFAVLHNKHGSVFFNQQGKAIYATKRAVGQFHEGLCSAVDIRNGRPLYGYLDKHFRWAIQPQFVKVDNFSEHLAGVCFYDPEKETLQKKYYEELFKKQKSSN